MDEYFERSMLGKQFEALRRSGLPEMVCRTEVQFWAKEAGYKELAVWVDEVSPDVYQVEAERFIQEWKGEDISPYSEDDVIDALDPAQKQAWEEVQA